MQSVTLAIPVFNEEEVLPLLLERIRRVAASSPVPFKEFLFVDDGSSDASLELLRLAKRDDPRIRVVVFIRNFGHQAALSAAIDFATGDALITMDADLQDPPEHIPALIEKWQSGYEMVYTIYTRRADSWHKRTSATLFYWALNILSNAELSAHAADFCLLDKKVVAAIRALPQRPHYLRGLRTRLGFSSTFITYERSRRAAGKSKYSLGKMLSLALDGILEHSFVSGVRLAYTGAGLSLISSVLFTLSAMSRQEFLFFLANLSAMAALAAFGLLGTCYFKMRERTQHPNYLVREIL